MRYQNAVLLLLGMAVAFAGCGQEGPGVVYEYVYSGKPTAVAVANSLSLEGSPRKGATSPKVVIIESSDFQ